MTPAGRAVSWAIAVTLLTGLGWSATAAAQTTPTTRPRTTIPTVSPQAGSFPVLQSADLPTGYRMGTGSPFVRDDVSAQYPTIDDCVWEFSNRQSGLVPTVYGSSFQKSATVTGSDTAIVFDSPKAAKALYDSFAKAYKAATKCKMTKSRSATTSEIVNYGTVELIDVGRLGDASFGATLTPSSSVVPEFKYAFIRDGDTFVTLRIADDDVGLKEFTKLARVAEERAS